MNIKTALKSAVVSLALAIASIPAFCVEPAVSYVPSDTSAVACINVSPLLKLGGKNGLFSDLLRGYFSSKIPSDLDSQIALFVFSGNRRAMIVSTNSKFDNESGIRNRLPKSTFVSNDRLQVIFTDDESVKKPDIFEENDSPSELVDSMDTEKSIVSVAMDMDAYFNLDKGTQKAMADIGVFLHCILTNNKQYMGHDDISNIVMSFVHTMQNIFFRKAKVLIFRIAPNSDGSLDMILTIRFKTEEAQTGFAEGFEKMKQMDASAFVDMIYNGQTMGPGAKGHEAEIEEHIQSMKDGIGKSAKSMEIEVSEDEIVITRKVSKDPDSVDDAFDGTIDLLSGILVHALMQNDARKKELGQGANRGNAPSAGGEPPDYEAMVPLEETPDPDEEGISDEEREERLKMREEALKRRQEKIAELEQNAAALEQQQRVAELNKEMFE